MLSTSKPKRAKRASTKQRSPAGKPVPVRAKANGHASNGMGMQAQKSDKKRQLIISSAVVMFASRGYDGVSLRDIAAQASFPLSTLYHYFQEKQTLYNVALVKSFEFAAVRTLPLFVKGGSPEMRVRRLVHLHTELLSHGYPEIKLIERALIDGHVTPEMQAGEIFDQIRDAYKTLFREIAPVRAAGTRWVELMEIFTGLIYGVNRFRPVHVKLIAGGITSSPKKLSAILADFIIEKIIK